MKTLTTLFAMSMLVFAACNGNKPGKASTDSIHVDASASGTVDSTGGAVISFEKTEHDFGNITQGEKAEYSFKFTNTGKSQLLISAVNASCGCTVPQYSKEPIEPGQNGYIKVTFDSDKRVDRFEKSVVVVSNTTPTENTLIIRGMVIPKPEDQYKMLHGQ